MASLEWGRFACSAFQCPSCVAGLGLASTQSSWALERSGSCAHCMMEFWTTKSHSIPWPGGGTRAQNHRRPDPLGHAGQNHGQRGLKMLAADMFWRVFWLNLDVKPCAASQDMCNKRVAIVKELNMLVLDEVDIMLDQDAEPPPNMQATAKDHYSCRRTGSEPMSSTSGTAAQQRSRQLFVLLSISLSIIPK